ncbi:MAG: 50S ribosomal protein L18 [Candidatus Marinimicrobia bacterium]|nr:50S ribosomal protein L18 [Candidatus Neomarinimicrobiota bacterium]MDD5229925.1 50S ribosomal protein L18 [Candidatus Neomarinimicrobiota bacterium]
MSKVKNIKVVARDRRQKRSRRKIQGTTERPRIAVFRSLNHIYAQVIDDSIHKSLFAVSDLTPEVRAQIKSDTKKSDRGELVGQILAEKALTKGIKKVVFDRSGYQYHGRVKALAEAARKAGLEF